MVLGPPDGTRRPRSDRRDLDPASARAALEGGVPQRVGPDVVLGEAGFADDGSPPGALVAVPDGRGGYAVAESLAEARARAGKVQGRSTSLSLGHPVACPTAGGPLTLRPPGWSPPTSSPTPRGAARGRAGLPLRQRGAFGGKLHSPVAADARRLADDYGRPVRVLWSREDVVRGTQRPPVAGGSTADGAGSCAWVSPPAVPIRGVGRGDAQVAAVAPGLALEAVDLAGPPLSLALRGAVWAEAAVLAAGARGLAALGPGAHSTSRRGGGPGRRTGGSPLPPRRLHRAGGGGRGGAGRGRPALLLHRRGPPGPGLGASEGVAVGADGAVRDLTVRSFGILQARAMPAVTVALDPAAAGPAVNGSDAAFAAVAAARWLADGLVGGPAGRPRRAPAAARRPARADRTVR